ncbi:hypothetical protein ACH5A3_39245 [Streptomyces echinatus]|uniref:hypothetical protein n=1 Tax=Streptomyces echinatus TaxID=67293 RepID=UPI00378C391F
MGVDLQAGGAWWVDEFVLVLAARGVTDRLAVQQRVWIEQLMAFASCPVWEVRPADVDGWMAAARERGTGPQTRGQMTQAVYRFYAFVETRYGARVREAVGRPVVCPVDEFNRPRRLARVHVRVPPSVQEIEFLFTAWRFHLPCLRGTAFLSGARHYVAASLWRRLGLRINESVRLRAGDWYPHAGTYGILHVRCGKGARSCLTNDHRVGMRALDPIALSAWRPASDSGRVPGQGKRRRRQEDARQRLAARTAPDAGQWEIVVETRDQAEMRTRLRRLQEAGVDGSMIRIDTLCGRLGLPTSYRLSRFVTDPARASEHEHSDH